MKEPAFWYIKKSEPDKIRSTWSAGIAKKLASAGYGVFAMDYPGFGLSDGLHGYIPSLDRLVDDVAEHFSKVKGNSVNLDWIYASYWHWYFTGRV